MSSLLVILGVLAAGINITFLILGLKSLKELKQIKNQVADLYPLLGLIKHIEDQHDETHGALKAQIAIESASLHKKQEELTQKTNNMTTMLLSLQQEQKEVKEHMSKYSAVLLSQDRLINTVGELVETISFGGKKQR